MEFRSESSCVFPLEYGPGRVVLLSAAAGGMAWGIRGQYGHETGAMLAGLILGFVWYARMYPWRPWSEGASMIALFTLAMGLGGSMTYGQTIGLTQDAPLVGNAAALKWGALGLAVKGGLWWGLGGLFLGLELGGRALRGKDVFIAFLLAMLLFRLGVYWWNEPFDPGAQRLPSIYFSDDWRWEPGGELSPRREVWGGLAAVYLGWLLYFGLRQGGALVWRLGLWGLLAGGLGFPIGQSVQALAVWRPEVVRAEFWGPWIDAVNWWNMMEITFGAVAGGVLGFGLWTHRKRIVGPMSPSPRAESGKNQTLMGLALLAHLILLGLVEFASIGWVDAIYDLGLAMIWIPVVGVVCRAYWAYAVVGPLMLIPYAGKTIRELVYRQDWIDWTTGWFFLGVLPLVVVGVLTLSRRLRCSAADSVAAILVLVYWGLNTAFFQFPVLREPWTYRAPSFLVLTGLAALTIGLSWRGQEDRR